MPKIIIVAGPNGAGKTSFANEFLPHHRETFTYVNADEIARSLPPQPGADGRDFMAGRLMLATLKASTRRLDNIMLETTLANRSYAIMIPSWRSLGYSVGLIYLRLSSVEQAIARVAKRVEAGGHGIPEAIIRRRFEKSQKYLDGVYKAIVDEWYVWESVEGDFIPAEAWDTT